MIDIQLIRTNPELVRENIRKKFQDKKLPLVDQVLDLDAKRRALIQEGDTLRAAALLLDQNIDTDTLFANLYMKEFHTLKFQAHVYKKMKISPAGVVYLYIDRAMQKKFKLTSEEASASISYLDSIKNSLIWLVCIENEDGSARVRLRSRFVTINEVAERYHGGGHACACGATVQNKKEFKALVSDADALLRDYKANNEGWL